MNLKPLFEMQKVLDDRIIKEKGLEGKDLLPEKILALQVELGELANEWRGFKFWSEDREPRTKEVIKGTDGRVNAIISNKNPLLEEYVDCLHFILSIGITRGYQLEEFEEFETNNIGVVKRFNYLFNKVGDFAFWKTFGNYQIIVENFVDLGKSLGFTWEQIEQAYKEKNATNHLRQSNGY